MSEIASMVPLIEKLQMSGITLVMIEHRLRELFRVANRVMVLSFGEKLIEGHPEVVMEDERESKPTLARKGARLYLKQQCQLIGGIAISPETLTLATAPRTED